MALRAPKFLPPLFFAAVALALCAPALFSGGRLILSSPQCDVAMQFLSWRDFGFRELRHFHLALWNPHIFSGMPFFGVFESALLYPPNWIGLVLGPAAAINAAIVLHLFLAGFFAFHWAREAAASRAGGALTGLVFMLSGPFFLKIHAGHLPPLAVMAWTPALFWALDGIERSTWTPARGAGLRAVLVAAFVALMQLLAGNPQYVYYAWLVAALYYAVKARRSGARAWAFAGGALVWAAAMAAVQLLAGLEAARESTRASFTFAQAASFGFPPENLATLFIPRLFGSLSRPEYYGRWYYWDACLFVGAGTLALAGSARWRAQETRAAAFAALAALLLALGPALPLYRFLYRVLPGYDVLRGTSKFAFLAALFLARLAGMGYDELKSGAWPRRWILFLFSATIGAAVGGYWALAHGMRVESAALWEGVAALAAATALLFYSHSSPRMIDALALFAAAELMIFAWTARSTMRPELAYPAPWKAVLEKNPGDYRILTSALDNRSLAMSAGAGDLMGYAQLSPRRYLEFMALSQGQDPARARDYPVGLKLSRLFGLLRLRYVFLEDRPAIELPGALPRLSLVGGARVLATREEVWRALARHDFNPTREVLLESAPDPAPRFDAGSGRARLLSDTGDALEIEAELSSSRILLVSDSYSSGWRARALPGSAQNAYSVLPADLALRAVPLSAGHHHFFLEYAPVGYRFGLWISLAAFAVYVGAWLLVQSHLWQF